MDHVSARDATRLGAHARRWRMRQQARSRHTRQPHPAFSERYQTPEWLERSFVLPLTTPEGSDVPSQPVRRHDDDPALEPAMSQGPDAAARPDPAAGLTRFVRPPSEDVDFARVIRRSDLSRTATRAHWTAIGLAGLSLLLYLLVGSRVALVAVVVLALVAVAAFVVRVRLDRAPVPRVQR